MEISWTQISAFAVVLPAVVAGIFLILRGYLDRESTRLRSQIDADNARLQARLTSGVKLAEFRQAWIDDLRKDMAACYTVGLEMHSDKKNTHRYLEIENRIRMRMNVDDENYAELVDCMSAIRQGNTPKAAFSALEPFVLVCQKILKGEWDKLRVELQSLSATEPRKNDN